MIRLQPIATPLYSSAASDVYKRQIQRWRGQLIRPECPAVSGDTQGHGNVQVEPEAVVGNGDADVHEGFTRHERESLSAAGAGDFERISCIATGERDRAAEPAADVDVVHHKPPAAWGRRIE